MTEESLASLLPAIDIAAFARNPDGAFTRVAAAPSWFRRLADATFPFLGHILEEANEFWATGRPGVREWGPCAEVGDDGVEFHYKVIAVTATDRQFLLFQRDHASDRMRETLQAVRNDRLANEQTARTVAKLIVDARRAAAELHDAVKALRPDSEDAWLSAVSEKTTEVMARLDELARELPQPGSA